MTWECQGGDQEGDEMVEHGGFPLTKETNGVEEIEYTLMCLNDEMIPILCEYESHLAHLSENEMSASTICEFECFHFEGMSDIPHELREVVDRSCEAISNSNNLPSTSSVFCHCVLGSIDDETPLLDMMVPTMENMYMNDEFEVTPCLHENTMILQGNNDLLFLLYKKVSLIKLFNKNINIHFVHTFELS